MRVLFSALLVAGLAVSARGQDAKQDPKKPEPSLKVGDPAPALKPTKWLQGTEVKEFAKDHVYVVEFWATWCGPCIVMMPHMSELQAQYKGKVTFVGFTSKDNNGNNQEKVSAFVEKRGPKLGYTFAYADNRETNDAWMKAANRNGIPCCFVVGKDGKIAYIGHPMYLDVVLPKVVEGTWAVADVEHLKQVEKDVNNVFEAFGNPDAEAGLKAVAEFDAKYPALVHIPYFVGPKLGLLIKAKKTDEAKKMAQDVIATAVKNEDSSALQGVARALTAAKDQKELQALGVSAAEASVKLTGDKDAVALYFLAEAYFATGDKAKAAETGKKAVAAADGGLKTQLEQLTKKYSEEKKDDK